MTTVQIYDTTLRDGAQGEGVNFSLQDKVLIAHRLDELGFDFVEGGFPLSNPKDAEFFQRIAKEPLKHSRLCAFGMTRRKGVKPAEDPGIKALIESHAPVVTIVGKTSDFHVTEVLRVSLEENLAMIRETLAEFRRSEDLIRLGAYAAGSSPRLDAALAAQEDLNRFLRQGRSETVELPATLAQLKQVSSMLV